MYYVGEERKFNVIITHDEYGKAGTNEEATRILMEKIADKSNRLGYEKWKVKRVVYTFDSARDYTVEFICEYDPFRK